MVLDYTLLIGLIGVPLAYFLLKMVGVIGLLYEILESMMMLPV